MSKLRATVLGLVVSSSACFAVPSGPDGGPVQDAGPITDVGTLDTGATDAGLMDGGAEDSGTDAGQVPAIWSEVQTILQAACKPCHNPGNRDDHTVVWVYGNLVRATGARFPLVVPGLPSESFLYVKIDDGVAEFCGAQTPPANRCGNVMPPPPTRERLLPWQIELVRAWIEAGAGED